MSQDAKSDSMEKLIAAVREHPCLWDLTHPDYRETQVKDDAWESIAIDCNEISIPNAKVAREKWRRLRDSHRDALKRAKLGRNKLLPAQITTWKYARSMQFLEPHMKYRITENIDTDGDDVRIAKLEAERSTSEDYIDAEDGNTHKRRCVESHSETSRLQQDGDALESFFSCMLKSTREMPPWMQTQIKKKIFGVIIEAEELLSSEQNSEMIDTKRIKTESFTEDSCDYI